MMSSTAEAAALHIRSAWPGFIIPLIFAGTVALTRGPYLQSITAASAIVVWRTDQPGSSRIEYGVGDYTRAIDLPDPTTEHVITLTDLITGTQVVYRVSTNGVELASGSFRTASGPNRPFTFAVIGDSGTGSRGQYAMADRLVALDPQFVLHTGDVIYPDGQAGGYDPFFFQPYQALVRRVPIFPALGNHDYHTQRGQPYLEAFYLPHNSPANTERYYSFDWGNAHFTALDFNTGPDPAQIAWLKEDLASTDRPWKFVFYHQAIYSSGPHGYESWVKAKRQLLAPIFEQFDVDIVFNGHDHNYERTQPIHDVNYLVSGGGGGPLYPVVPQSFSAYAESTYHTVFITIDGCRLTLQAIRPDGMVFDTLTLTKMCLVLTPEPTLAPAPAIVFEGPFLLPVIWKKP
jgi:predicted phosphodiesterase